VNTGCSLFIAKSLNINNGDGGMSSNNCVSTFGNAAFATIAIAE